MFTLEIAVPYRNVTMLSVLDVMKASDGYERPIREGEEILRSGLVVGVGLKGKDKDEVTHVQALVLRTSGITSKHPYLLDLWLDLTKPSGERLINEKSECECPAGQSLKCKHLIAVMLWLTRLV